jgi:hypothetical protein
MTKPIVLQREWIKFWHLLGFHVDPEIPKYGQDSHKTKRKAKLPLRALLQDLKIPRKLRMTLPSKRSKRSFALLRFRQLLFATCYAADLRLKCVSTVLALATWLAANWSSSPSNEGRPKGVCSEGWEVEEPSRAIGFKKVQKVRGHEPTAQDLPRENVLEDLPQKQNLQILGSLRSGFLWHAPLASMHLSYVNGIHHVHPLNLAVLLRSAIFG